MNQDIKHLFDISFYIEIISATPEVFNSISLQNKFELTINVFKLSGNEFKKNQDYTFKVKQKNELTKNDLLRQFLQFKIIERTNKQDLSEYDEFIDFKINSMSTLRLIESDIMDWLLIIRDDIPINTDFIQSSEQKKLFEDAYFENI
jgi:hypothetical protein